MIPHTIHYCWLSGEPMPDKLLKMMDSWRVHCPGWKLRLWDMEAVKDVDNRFMREAIECRKWAFATDFIRLYALEKEGGVYLDTDVELLGGLDRFMDNRAFMAREFISIDNSRPVTGLSSHLIGAEAHHPFIRACLEYYADRRFVLTANTQLPDSLRYDMHIMPLIQARIAQRWGYDPAPSAPELQQLADGLTIYPATLFSSGQDKPSTSVAHHYLLGGWREEVLGGSLQRPALWRRMMSRLNMRPLLERTLKRMGYMVIRIK